MNERENHADSVEDLQSYKTAMRDNSESTSWKVAVKSDWVVTGRLRPNLSNQRFNEDLIAIISPIANSIEEALNRPLFR